MLSNRITRNFVLLMIIFSFNFCGPSIEISEEDLDKIEFNIDIIDHDGLYGPDGGLRSMDYEFCIPADEKAVKEVFGINPKIKIDRHAPGRSACGEGKYLCLGNTQQPGWKTKLLKLASLEYVKEIKESYWE